MGGVARNEAEANVGNFFRRHARCKGRAEMTRTSTALFAISALGLAACGARSADMFSRGSTGSASGGSTSYSPEAGAAGTVDDVSIQSGGAASSSGGASPVAQAGATDAAGAPDLLPPITLPVCVPALEQCNGVDDDCDGVVDEGCPVAFSRSDAVQRESLGDSDDGSDFAETCAANEVLVGLKVGVGAWIDQVTAVCQKYSLSTNTQTVPYQCSFPLGTQRELAAYPPTTTSPLQELTCRDGTVMVGVHISQQNTAFDQYTDQIVVPQIWLDCAALFLDVTDAPPQLQWQTIEPAGPVTGSFAATDAWFESDTLDTTQVLVGFHGATSTWVDRVGLTASSLSVVLKPE